MDLRLMLVIALLTVLFVALLNFGYLTYAIHTSATSQVGKDLFAAKKLFFYTSLALHVTALLIGAGLFVKR